MIQILTSQPSSLKENMFFHKWPSIWRPHSRRAMISNPNKRLANWQRLLEWPLLPFKYWNETACPQIPWWNGKVAAWNPSIDFESEMSASHYVTSLCHCSTFPCFTILRNLQSEASIPMRQRLDSYGIMFTAHGAKQCKAFLLGHWAVRAVGVYWQYESSFVSTIFPGELVGCGSPDASILPLRSF